MYLKNYDSLKCIIIKLSFNLNLLNTLKIMKVKITFEYIENYESKNLI